MLGVLVLVPAAQAAVPVVTNVVASQQASNKLVDIYYDVFDDDGDTLKVRVEVSDNGGNLYSVPAFTFTGDIGEGVTTGASKHIVWDAGADWDGEYSDQMRVKVIAADGRGLPGLEWGNEVPPGGFLMGQDGGAEGSGPSVHVNIPWSFWLSKFEIKNDEYCGFLNSALVAGDVYREGTAEARAEMGQYPGVPGDAKLLELGDTKDIRWNVNNFEVVGGKSNFPVSVTWFGAMAFAQHYGYDLPTDAEWEKATRGPDHDDEDEHLAYPWGNTIGGGNANYRNSGDPYDNAKTPVGYFDGNQTPFGADMANGYGLYDTAGNVDEWCRSQWGGSVESYQQQESLSNTLNAISTSADRVYRGGHWYEYTGGSWENLKSFLRRYVGPGTYSDKYGFRVVRRDLHHVDPRPVVSVYEDFEGAEWTAQGPGSWTVHAPSGTWSTDNHSYVLRNEALSHSSTGLVRLSYPSFSAYLTIPSTTDMPIGVSCWGRAVQSDRTAQLYLQEYDGTTWRHTDQVSVSGIEYRRIRLNVVLSQPTSGERFRLYGEHGIYIDDVEVFTVPLSGGSGGT